MTAQKKFILSSVLFLGIILLSGCETAKGAAYGTVDTVGAAAKGVGATACGAAKDTANLWQGILKADDWMKKNLW